MVSTSDKWKFTLYTVLFVVVLFNQYAFITVNKLLGSFVGAIADRHGCPTLLGFVVHTLVFTLVLRYSMDYHK